MEALRPPTSSSGAMRLLLLLAALLLPNLLRTTEAFTALLQGNNMEFNLNGGFFFMKEGKGKLFGVFKAHSPPGYDTLNFRLDDTCTRDFGMKKIKTGNNTYYGHLYIRKQTKPYTSARSFACKLTLDIDGYDRPTYNFHINYNTGNISCSFPVGAPVGKVCTFYKQPCQWTWESLPNYVAPVRGGSTCSIKVTKKLEQKSFKGCGTITVGFGALFPENSTVNPNNFHTGVIQVTGVNSLPTCIPPSVGPHTLAKEVIIIRVPITQAPTLQSDATVPAYTARSLDVLVALTALLLIN